MKKGSGNNSRFLEVLRSMLNPEPQRNIEHLYDYTNAGNRRWANLIDYLLFMKTEDPDILMIGEAPGYRGTSISGVPFLSEQMIELRQQKKLESPLHSYTFSEEDNLPYYEATSSIVWSVIDRYPKCKLPLLWATLPNHPHNPDTILSNRKPNKQEIEPYLMIIELLVAEYAIKQVVAIGSVAYDTLISNGYDDIVKIRHPARGGAYKFADGYARLIKEYYGKH